ncbi:FAD/NAD(P)-binding domain-containing protein [Coccomyxa subellipsoidea C-169]|uniref:NADH:ubiquinone reductase (non-electrogenic) n=1 Tax=Coccomyxa subellipsoidea (strain C-169) TaxID=574566 RepID=I0Z0S4_COCSC|nr:FAD/NAD(P)-binding domain-containing protein [Coccomyxa subellipsoidea C-169]EIE24243.1 FAD/NAD(P)-binding domain-containing protein [Coccomyxa subellipsoidea C-169]|eukprot:XP_005648787.1 FAD/NAD(P)-binding domain-containing protein [Coccomyxa subellipsoidea C-169]
MSFFRSPEKPFHCKDKPTIVILGTGWGAISFLRALKPLHSNQYNVQIVSPRNYFLYTPLLPASATGTVDTHSIVDPIRSHLDARCNYYEAECLNIDAKEKILTCGYTKPFREASDAGQKDHTFQMKYDVLIVAIGAVTNTFGVPGVDENCFYMKSAEDAKALRERINACFELANLPDTTDEERKRLLSFVIVGGGPTGTELAAEMNDLVIILEDMLRYFPRITRSQVTIKQIDSHDHILSAFDRTIAEYATEHFRRSGIDLVLACRVKAVEPGAVVVQKGKETDRIPFGTCIWTTGIRMHPLAERLADGQEHWRSLMVDNNLRVKGSDSIFALGDAATIEQERVLRHAEELFEQGDANHDGMLSSDELQQLLLLNVKKYPQLAEIAARVPKNTVLSKEAFLKHLEELDKSLRSVPATAQAAHQEGHYLGKLFRKYKIDPATKEVVPEDAPEFEYKPLGTIAYIGHDKAVLDPGPSAPFLRYIRGWLMGLGWKSAEVFMQISYKNMWLVSRDFLKAKIFGRDISDV